MIPINPFLDLTAFPEGLLDAHRGQALDIQWRDKVQCPTEGQYIDMVKNSTPMINYTIDF